MKLIYFLATSPWILSLALAAPAAAQTDRLEKHVEHLASTELEGRLTGSPGAEKAATYIIEEMEKLGVKPLPGQDHYRVAFDFTAGTRDAGTTAMVRTAEGQESVYREEVQALSFSGNEKVSGTVYFAGYGLVVPESQGLPYDSYAGADVQDKIVLVLRYFPEDAEPEARTILARYAGLRHKAMMARERGARALLVVTGPRSPNAGELIPMSFDTAISGSGIGAASLTGELADILFKQVADKTLEEAQKSFDTANPHVTGFEIPGVELTLDAKVHREKREGNNVVGYLPATTQADTGGYVMLGAHYDHLGRGGHGNSLAKKEEQGQIHFGADDNASGVATVLEIASRLVENDRTKPLLIGFWSGEEIGLLGSSHFIKTALPADRIAAYVNFDMVGRMKDNKLALRAVGTSSVWPRLIEQTNVVVGFDINTSDDPYQPTDVMNFNNAGVPSLDFFTGGHVDYHRPTDVASAINYEDMERVVDFSTLLVEKLMKLDEPPQFVKVERSVEATGSRASLRAFTGTIPDYTTEAEGLRLSGVIEGGPADEVGLQEGDVIVEFAGHKITNIYDYTYALDAVKIGEPVKVVIQRGDERIEMELTPRARK